ncbi:hypothetical protein B0J18DRAFT_459098 [Chaetomium sp. MPI-SDFR-AT-0129]|nr:hypothetical protein B0J18DRAFT_459098 [Chaetomium sp. MPI-SDFR-AT-0129]
MPRNGPRRAGKPRTQIDYSELELEEDQYQTTPECKQAIVLSDWVRKWTLAKYILLGILGIGLLAAAFFLAVALALIIRAVTTDNTGFDSSHPEFALYKNTRFKACSSSTSSPDTTLLTEPECAIIRANLTALSGSDFGYLDRDLISSLSASSSSSNTNTNTTKHTWCALATCLSTFTVLPSNPLPAATILPHLLCWWTVMATSAGALWSASRILLSAFQTPGSNSSKPCRGRRDMSILDWLFLAYDLLGPILLWWVSFGLFASSPAQSATVAITAWVAAWKLGAVMRYHPYSCLLGQLGEGAKKWVPRGFQGMALLQWAGGVYVMVVYLGEFGGKGDGLRGYECSSEEVGKVLGQSPVGGCSAEELCGREGFFRNREYRAADMFTADGRFALIAYFWIWTLMAVLPFVFLLIGWLGNKLVGDSAEKVKEDARYVWKVFNPGPSFYLAFASFISIFFSVSYAIHAVQTWNDAGGYREGVVIFHEGCQALHVQLSPWRDFLDLSDYARAYRIVKMMFVA